MTTHEQTLAELRPPKRRCSVEACGAKHLARGLCEKHYSRHKRTGRTDVRWCTTHGMSGTRQYNIWCKMRSRCLDPRDNTYVLYGEKGIGVSPDWDTFERFWQDMGPSYFEEATIDRIDNTKGYSKDNCRWATRQEQSQNRRCVRRFAFNGNELTLSELSKETGIHRDTLYWRLVVKEWSLEKATSPTSHVHA